MAIFKGIGQRIASAKTAVQSAFQTVKGKVSGAISAARQRRADKRDAPPEPPEAYRRKQAREKAAAAPPPPPPPVQPPPPPTRPTGLPDAVGGDTGGTDYQALYEHRDELTSILYRLDMPSDFIEAIVAMDIEEYAEADFTILNSALEKLQKYVDAYGQGVLPEYVDLDFYAYQVGESLGLDYYEFGGSSGLYDDIPF